MVHLVHFASIMLPLVLQAENSFGRSQAVLLNVDFRGEIALAANTCTCTNEVAATVTSCPRDGVFIDEIGTRYEDSGPWLIGGVWVFGGNRGDAWFRMASVDVQGRLIESRYSRTSFTLSMSQPELEAIWENAHKGGRYTAEVTSFCTTPTVREI